MFLLLCQMQTLHRINKYVREIPVRKKIIRRMNTMSNEKKNTQEDAQAIVEEILRKANLQSAKELNSDEMGKISGGEDLTAAPKTHEEVDQLWDLIDLAYEVGGKDAAYIMAQKFELVPGANGSGHIFSTRTPRELRAHWHRRLDGKSSGFFPK